VTSRTCLTTTEPPQVPRTENRFCSESAKDSRGVHLHQEPGGSVSRCAEVNTMALFGRIKPHSASFVLYLQLLLAGVPRADTDYFKGPLKLCRVTEYTSRLDPHYQNRQCVLLHAAGQARHVVIKIIKGLRLKFVEMVPWHRERVWSFINVHC
jgi:hypothetical protein